MTIIPKNTVSSKRKGPTKAAALILALALLLCALPAAASEAAESLTIGYLAASGAKLNPFVCNERDMISINSLIYESLFELDGQMQPQPVLAESWLQENNQWLIRIRSGVMFHNGVELVAQDVVDSFNLFKSVGAANPYSSRLSSITSMEVYDTFTLLVTAKYPGMMALYALTFPVVQRGTFSSEIAMGTGPYWCLEYEADNLVHLEANPYWWKQQPEIKQITFRHYWGIGDLLEALQVGEVDMFQTRSNDAALTKKLSFASSLDYATTTYEVLIPNLRSGVMSDVRVRQAVMYAIDYNNLVSNAYLDMAQQCEVPVSPNSWLYESRSAVYYYSPERALQLLYEAGWSDLTGDTLLNKLEDNILSYLDVKIVVYDDATSNVRSNAADLIAKNLQAVGIRATVTTGTLDRARKAAQGQDCDLALVAFNLSETPDLSPLLAGNGSINYNIRDNQKLDALVKATQEAADETSMQQAFSDLQLYLVEDLPIMGLGFRSGMLLSTRNLGGLTATRESDAYSGMEFMK